MANTPNLNLPLVSENATADVPRDMNGLATAVDTNVKTALENVKVPDASLTEKGIVQLSSSTTGTRETVAATEKAVGLAFQAGNERKAEVVAALVAIGVQASTSESWAQLIPKIAAVIRATGDASAGDVLAGKIFSNVNGNGLIGTMPNRGAGGTVTPGTTDQTKAAGYYSSAITILGDADLVAGNFPNDVNLFGIQGALERLTTADRNAIIAAIVSKGVAATSADTNAQLATKIRQINTGSLVEYSVADRQVTTTLGTYYNIVDIPKGKQFLFTTSAYKATSISADIPNYNPGDYCNTFLLVRNGINKTTIETVARSSAAGRSDVYIRQIQIDNVSTTPRYRYGIDGATGWSSWFNISGSTTSEVTLSFFYELKNAIGNITWVSAFGNFSGTGIVV